MKYEVEFIVKGKFRTIVEADSTSEAMEIAESNWCDADFGELINTDGEVYSCVDDNGNEYFI